MNLFTDRCSPVLDGSLIAVKTNCRLVSLYVFVSLKLPRSMSTKARRRTRLWDVCSGDTLFAPQRKVWMPSWSKANKIRWWPINSLYERLLALERYSRGFHLRFYKNSGPSNFIIPLIYQDNIAILLVVSLQNIYIFPFTEQTLESFLPPLLDIFERYSPFHRL